MKRKKSAAIIEIIQDFRPDAIIWAYWKELLDIEPNALCLTPDYMESL